MKKLTGLERILTTLRHEEPDQVPTFEADIDRKVMDAMRPGMSYEDFAEDVDLDGLILHQTRGDEYETLDKSKRLVKNKWGTICQFGAASEYAAVPHEYPIKSEEDIKGYVVPDPDVSGVYPVMEEWVKRFKGDRAIIVHVDDPAFTVRDMLLGQVEYFKLTRKNPELIHKLTEITGEYHLQYIKNCIDIGADMVFMGSDLAMTNGPFMSPEDTDRFHGTYCRKIVKYAKDKGLPSLRHSDGNVWSLFQMIIDWGFDAIHPIDPIAGMDLAVAKEKYGDQVTLVGNVDCTAVMSWGTIDEVREEVKRCMRQAAKGGGYICATSNTVHSATKPENYLAMLDAIKEYGRYPIQEF